MTTHDKHTCPRCQIGSMMPTTATYSTVYRAALLSVPNIPAWNCDICGYIEYDDETMTRLEALVGEYVLSNDTARMNAKLPPLDADGEVTDGKPSTRSKSKS
jgi:YgiT-type zinc finger domain-containing protein